MSETQTASSSSSAPVGGSTTSNNGSSPTSSEKINIKVSGTGGGFSLDEFNRAAGVETDNIDEADEPEIEEGSGELLDDPKEATTDPKIEDRPSDEEEDSEAQEEDDEDEEENSEDEVALEEVAKGVKKGGIKALTKDGKALTLPPDLEIIQNIDGEERKINLREHLNVVAGELTVDKRLTDIGVFRSQIEKRRQELEGFHSKFQEGLQTMAQYAKEGRPDYAICFLAEMNGISPIQMRQQFLKTLVSEAQKFEGKTEVEIQNYYLNLERQWREGKDKKRQEAEAKAAQANQFVAYVTEELKKENISPEEFTTSSQELGRQGELQNLNQEQRLDRIIEHALLTKHATMAKEAISLVDPKLVNNRVLFDKLLEATHPNRFTVEEMADVLADYLGKARTRIASSLSKKVRTPQQVQANSERQNGAGKKQKVYRSQGDLQRAFGL